MTYLPHGWLLDDPDVQQVRKAAKRYTDIVPGTTPATSGRAASDRASALLNAARAQRGQ